MNQISFFVPGIPKPAGSKRAFIIKNRQSGKQRAIVTDANPNSRDWKIDVQHVARSKYMGKPLLGPLILELCFYADRPKGHYGSGRNATVLKPGAPRYPLGRPDATKLTRGVEDALTGILWADDAQIVNQVIWKCYSDDAQPRGVHVRVQEIGL